MKKANRYGPSGTPSGLSLPPMAGASLKPSLRSSRVGLTGRGNARLIPPRRSLPLKPIPAERSVPVMRTRQKLLVLSLSLLLTACAAQPAAPAATPTPAAPTAAPTATPAPTAAPEPTPAPEPAGETLAYDELRLVAVGRQHAVWGDGRLFHGQPKRPVGPHPRRRDGTLALPGRRPGVQLRQREPLDVECLRHELGGDRRHQRGA